MPTATSLPPLTCTENKAHDRGDNRGEMNKTKMVVTAALLVGAAVAYSYWAIKAIDASGVGVPTPYEMRERWM